MTKPVFALAERSLRRLDQEWRTFSAAEADLLSSLATQDEGSGAYVAVLSRASAIESLYTGMEATLKAVLDAVGETVGSAADQGRSRWHAQLLAQASLANADRPAVISDRLYGRLDEFRKFRHLERNIYGFELDPARVASLGRSVIEVVPEFNAEIVHFMDIVSRDA